MAALVPIAVGFVAKPLDTRVPVGVSIAAAEVLDILAIIFSLLGIESEGSIPWSHGFLMSFIWSFGFGALYFLIHRRFRTGIFVSVLAFSHWVIDFVTHPMGDRIWRTTSTSRPAAGIQRFTARRLGLIQPFGTAGVPGRIQHPDCRGGGLHRRHN